jgi:hypothetical protein
MPLPFKGSRLRKVEALRQFARELCDAQQAGPAHLTPQWRTFSPSAHPMVAPEYRVRCAVRDTGANGGKRFHWTVTILRRSRPVAAGRAGELAEARALAEMALGTAGSTTSATAPS